ncbi:unnamed protein product [Acanthosepion pharaonis]|uniref:Uncharacterized protein n=1 Tax=Acanthosepion pharaonis TaxID=158019 RepID=A0A812E9X9_ACAPH|nr:unnamed protein product [Sepia pharaonis]
MIIMIIILSSLLGHLRLVFLHLFSQFYSHYYICSSSPTSSRLPSHYSLLPSSSLLLLHHLYPLFLMALLSYWSYLSCFLSHYFRQNIKTDSFYLSSFPLQILSFLNLIFPSFFRFPLIFFIFFFRFRHFFLSLLLSSFHIPFSISFIHFSSFVFRHFLSSIPIMIKDRFYFLLYFSSPLPLIISITSCSPLSAISPSLYLISRFFLSHPLSLSLSHTHTHTHTYRHV